MRYKFVEVAPVTDEALEQVVNQMVGHGWQFEGILFAMRDNSHRPAMAFVVFVSVDERAPTGPKETGESDE